MAEPNPYWRSGPKPAPGVPTIREVLDSMKYDSSPDFLSVVDSPENQKLIQEIEAAGWVLVEPAQVDQTRQEPKE